MRVLLIEDDRMMARSIELMLQAGGFLVEKTQAGEDGVDLAAVYDFDLILLDLNLPDMSGLEVLRTLRRGKNETPILVLSGTLEIESKVRALSLGADDYMTKPFHKDELIARLRAVIRRSKGHAQSVITIGDMVIDLDSKIVHVNSQRIHLTGREYQTLELLALRKGKTLTKDVFLSSLYGGMDEPGAKIVDVFICKLRKKLAPATDGRHVIETVWGGGYVLREADEPTVQSAA
jgi:two-component system, cell cycle response regulator CtrA